MDGNGIPEWDTEMRELADGVFAFQQATGGFCISNAGLITGGGEAIAIDALFSPPMTLAFKKAAKRASKARIRRVVNTHHHVDHSLGNFLFPKATIIAQERARQHIIRNGFPKEVLLGLAPWFKKELKGDIRVRPPDVTFERTMTLWAGDRRIELTHVGTAHTVGDVLAHLPAEKVLFAGDVCFFYVTPLAFEGHIANWIRALLAIELMADVDVVVPGHGPVGTKEQVREVRAYFEVITNQARELFDAGLDEPAAAARVDLGVFAGWGEWERIVPNVYRLFAEFRGNGEGPIDVTRAFAGMAELAAKGRFADSA